MLDTRPLAARMRPTHLSEYVGQQHLLGEDQPLRRSIEAGLVQSMILWGEPGTGKTTLAHLIASSSGMQFLSLSAVTSGIKDIRCAIDQAVSAQQKGQKTLLFVDEVHRFNTTQQDAFLPHIEEGLFTFIGATTENPSFALNNALLSRVRVYVLKPLIASDLMQVLKSAIQDKAKGLGTMTLEVPEATLDKIIALARGDARQSLYLLDLAAQTSGSSQVTPEDVTRIAGDVAGHMDARGDKYYDLISAFHKSIRGSNPDAALYWLSRMLVAGVDPLYPARRLLAIASEDIGNADPQAMHIALNAWQCFERVGAAEGERAIAQAAVYLAMAPKSNAVYEAFNQAKELAQKTMHLKVPDHLCNAPTQLMQSMGKGKGYRYAHYEPQAYAAGVSYLPEALQGTNLYHPTEYGFEKRIHDKLHKLALLDHAYQKAHDDKA
tara:strand:+ start:1341 stop:2648 length:1308 start_codon:yes stop_codon:yes gene_type:complete